MGQTPNLSLPYPELGDSADVPRDIKALADTLDAVRALNVPVVTSLPGSPADGQECYFQSAAMATDGVIWHLRYRAASPSAYKWELLGGGALPPAAATAGETLPANTNAYTDAPSGKPSVIVPLAGDYEAIHGGSISYNTGGPGSATTYIGIKGGANAPADTDACVMSQSAAGQLPVYAMSRSVRLNGVGAGLAIKQQYRTGGAGVGLSLGSNRFIAGVRPVRVG